MTAAALTVAIIFLKSETVRKTSLLTVLNHFITGWTLWSTANGLPTLCQIKLPLNRSPDCTSTVQTLFGTRLGTIGAETVSADISLKSLQTESLPISLTLKPSRQESSDIFCRRVLLPSMPGSRLLTSTETKVFGAQAPPTPLITLLLRRPPVLQFRLTRKMLFWAGKLLPTI